MAPEGQGRQHILLGHLGSYGDCLYATTIARQIKSDFPGCHLTWAVGSMYADILNNNPYVDDVWNYPIHSRDELLSKWGMFRAEAEARRGKGDFSHVFFTQVFPGNLRFYDGTLRSSIFRAYGKDVTVPVDPVLVLSDSEVEKVRGFADRHALAQCRDVVLFECEPASGQSRLTSHQALAMTLELCEKHPDLKVILTAKEAIPCDHPQVIDGSELSFRENAELTRYCSLLVGVSSGISWLNTSAWSQTLPCIQVLNFKLSVYASLKHDHGLFKLPVEEIIELPDEDLEQVKKCISLVIEKDFQTAKKTCDQEIPVRFLSYFDSIRYHCFRTRSVKGVSTSFGAVFNRYGYRWVFFGDLLLRMLHTIFIYPLWALRNKFRNRGHRPVT